MTTLLVARHGETEWHADNAYAGSSDVPLTPKGHEQASRLGGGPAGAGIESVWCSPLGRARATAAPAAATLGLAPNVDDDLREVDFGVAEGRRLTDLDPEVVRAFREDP